MKRVLIFLTIVATSLSCSEINNTVDDLAPRKDIALTKAQAEFVKANNGFALDLFKNVVREDKDKSLLISPLSVTIDFGMVNNGAVGNTQQEIYETLGYKEGSVEGLNDFCKLMMKESAAVDPSTTLEIANAAVINKMHAGLKDSFTKTVKSVYDAEVIYKDFSKENIKKLVNDWCKRKTHGMISELLTEPVDPSEYAHFLNAVYFKGVWANKFKKSDTNKEVFKRDDGTKTNVRMMHQKDHFSFGGIRDLCTAVCLPYGNQAYRMTLILPIEGKKLSDVAEALDVDSWNILSMLSDAEVDVKIPSFETEYFVSLAETLQKMGISQAFRGDADFSAMTTASVYVSDVLHKAKIKVDEDGSEAAAVTDIVMKFGAAFPMPEPQVCEFHADRPFLYLITEVSTGAIFFIGQYTGR